MEVFSIVLKDVPGISPRWLIPLISPRQRCLAQLISASWVVQRASSLVSWKRPIWCGARSVIAVRAGRGDAGAGASSLVSSETRSGDSCAGARAISPVRRLPRPRQPSPSRAGTRGPEPGDSGDHHLVLANINDQTDQFQDLFDELLLLIFWIRWWSRCTPATHGGVFGMQWADLQGTRRGFEVTPAAAVPTVFEMRWGAISEQR